MLQGISVSIVACALLLFGIAPETRAAQVDAIWNGGPGSWNTPGLWTPAVVPNNGAGGNTYRVFIDNGNATASPVTLNVNQVIDQLNVSAGDSLSFANSFDLTIAQGPIVNNGLISLNSVGTATELVIATSMSLTGTGVLLLGNNSANFIDDADNAAGPLLVNGVGHTIRGSGQLGTDAVAMTNDGLIDANQSVTLVVDLLAAGPNTNSGTMQSSGSGTLDITGTVLNNANGLIQALDTSTVNIINSSISGGVLHADPGSAISPSTSTTVFSNITLTGLLRHDNSDDATYTGTITNNGTIALNSSATATEIVIPPPGTTFTGAGEIVMSSSTANFIDDNDAGLDPLLVNSATHTIRGGGEVGTNGLHMTNDGLIQADQTTALVLDLTPGANINNGTLQSIGTSTLDINGTVLTNTDGLIQALGTSTVNINGSSILGGTLHADAGSAISPNGGTNLFQDITLTGLIRHDNSEDAAYVGTITNNGTIAMNSIGTATEIVIPPPGTTFTGTGEIVMSSNTANFIDDNDAGLDPLLINSATHTIRGGGNIGFNGFHMTNEGLIQADQATALAIDLTAGPNVNNGILQSIGTSTLDITGTVITNTDGLIQALGTSTVNINGSSILGGVLHADAGSAISPNTGTNLLQDITLTGLIRHDNAEDAAYGGTITNNGTIALNSIGTATEIVIPPTGTTFTGPGEIVMSNNSANFIDNDDTAAIPSIVNGLTHTIRGAGEIINVALTNQGTIIADQIVALVIDPENAAPGFLNPGIVQVTGAGGLQIRLGQFSTSGTVNIAATRVLTRTGPYNQTAGITTVNGNLNVTGAVELQGGTLTGNGTVSGSGSTVANSGTIAPGDGIGNLNLNSGLNQNPDGEIAIEIGGLTPVTQHDRLAVLQSTHLDGTLSVSFVNGFDPQVGDSFTVITYSHTDFASLGFFRTFDAPCDLPGRALQVDVFNTFVRVTVVAAANALYDVNCDCVFSYASDASAFVTALLFPATFATDFPGCDILNADFNNDNLVDGQDVQGFVEALIN